MLQVSEQELGAMFLRGGYEGQFRLHVDGMDYIEHGPIEKCLNTFTTICKESDAVRWCTLSIGYPQDINRNNVAYFYLKYTEDEKLEMTRIALRQAGVSRYQVIDVVAGELPRQRKLNILYPPKRKWYKRLFLSTLFFCAVMLLLLDNCAHAQVSFKLSDLTKQNKKNLQYMAQQIAEIQLYLKALKKGYNIVRSGLATIHSIKNGEFDVHNLFYTGLWKVNPEIRKLPEAIRLMDFSQKAYRNCQRLTNDLRKDTILAVAERNYLLGVCDNLVADIDANIDALATILTPGKVQMDDQERTRRINNCYGVSGRQLRISHALNAEAATIAHARVGETIELQTIINYHKK